MPVLFSYVFVCVYVRCFIFCIRVCARGTLIKSMNDEGKSSEGSKRNVERDREKRREAKRVDESTGKIKNVAGPRVGSDRNEVGRKSGVFGSDLLKVKKCFAPRGC